MDWGSEGQATSGDSISLAAFAFCVFHLVILSIREYSSETTPGFAFLISENYSCLAWWIRWIRLTPLLQLLHWWKPLVKVWLVHKFWARSWGAGRYTGHLVLLYCFSELQIRLTATDLSSFVPVIRCSMLCSASFAMTTVILIAVHLPHLEQL